MLPGIKQPVDESRGWGGREGGLLRAHLCAAGRKARHSYVDTERSVTRARTALCGAGGSSFSLFLSASRSISISLSLSFLLLLPFAGGVRKAPRAEGGRADPAKAATTFRGHGLGRQPGVQSPVVARAR